MTSREKMRSAPSSPMPRFCQGLAYRTIEIPNPSEPTVGGKEVVRISTMPDRYEYDYPGKVLEVQPAKFHMKRTWNKYALPASMRGPST